MDNFLVQLILGIGTAIFGAIVSYVIPLLLQFRINRQRKELGGKWLSYGHTGSDKTKWVTDEIEINITFFGIYIQNTNTEFGYEGKGQLVDSRQLSGTWYSRRPGAYDSGPFMFIISPQGNFMYGNYIGRNENGENYFLGWCLGRDQNSLEQAKESLSRHTLALAGNDDIYSLIDSK